MLGSQLDTIRSTITGDDTVACDNIYLNSGDGMNFELLFGTAVSKVTISPAPNAFRAFTDGGPAKAQTVDLP